MCEILLRHQPYIERHLRRYAIPRGESNNRDMKRLEFPLYLLHVSLCIWFCWERDVHTQYEQREDLFY